LRWQSGLIWRKLTRLGSEGWAEYDRGRFSIRRGLAMQAQRTITGFASCVVKRGIKRPAAKDELADAESVANRGTGKSAVC
jgi:hypothetical protein